MKKTFTCEINARRLGVIKCEAVSDRGNVYTGKAVCSPQDQFSLQTGMRIAEIRALIKQLKLVEKNSMRRMDILESKYDREQANLMRISSKIEDLEDELSELAE